MESLQSSEITQLSANVPQSILCCLPNPISTTCQVPQITESAHPRTFVREVSLILGKEEHILQMRTAKGLTQPC